MKYLNKCFSLQLEAGDEDIYKFLKALGKEKKKQIVLALVYTFPNAIEQLEKTENNNWITTNVIPINKELDNFAENRKKECNYEYELSFSFSTSKKDYAEAYCYAILNYLYNINENIVNEAIVYSIRRFYSAFLEILKADEGLNNTFQFAEFSGDKELLRENAKKAYLTKHSVKNTKKISEESERDKLTFEALSDPEVVKEIVKETSEYKSEFETSEEEAKLIKQLEGDMPQDELS